MFYPFRIFICSSSQLCGTPFWIFHIGPASTYLANINFIEKKRKIRILKYSPQKGDRRHDTPIIIKYSIHVFSPFIYLLWLWCYCNHHCWISNEFTSLYYRGSSVLTRKSHYWPSQGFPSGFFFFKKREYYIRDPYGTLYAVGIVDLQVWWMILSNSLSPSLSLFVTHTPSRCIKRSEQQYQKKKSALPRPHQSALFMTDKSPMVPIFFSSSYSVVWRIQCHNPLFISITWARDQETGDLREMDPSVDSISILYCEQKRVNSSSILKRVKVLY